jgi:tripartite-type tricarboxylate transporter receptor subunit TctC
MRRRTLLAAALPALCAVAAPAFAQPAPVKVLVGFPPGTAADMATRAVTDQMARRLGQPFVVENRPGAGSNIAAKAAATALPDGLNLFAITIANSINAGFPNSTAVNPVKEFAPVLLLGNVPNVLVVHPSLKVNSLAELVAHLKARPGEVSYASSGIGTSPHLSGEQFAQMSGVKIVHVPYRGSTPAVTDLLGGQVQMMFSPASSVLQHVRAGNLKALAVTTPVRTPVAPDLPTLHELGLKGFNTSVWIGLVAPAGTPQPTLARLRAAASAALDSTEVQTAYRAQGIDPYKLAGEDFARFLQGESTRWARFIQASGIKPE